MHGAIKNFKPSVAGYMSKEVVNYLPVLRKSSPLTGRQCSQILAAVNTLGAPSQVVFEQEEVSVHRK